MARVPGVRLDEGRNVGVKHRGGMGAGGGGGGGGGAENSELESPSEMLVSMVWSGGLGGGDEGLDASTGADRRRWNSGRS